MNPNQPPREPRQVALSLRRQLERATELCNHAVIPRDDYSRWRRTTEDLIVRAFGPDSANLARFRREGEIVIGPSPWESTEADLAGQRKRDIADEIAILLSCLEQLASGPAGPAADAAPPGLLLVYGRDDPKKAAVVRFLEAFGLPVGLRRDADDGIHSLADEPARVGFVIVLLSGDDRGGLQGVPLKHQKPRARQGVVLDLGYFLGRVGPGRVCVLYQPNVELPVDDPRVLALELDRHNRWRRQLARALKAAGFAIDPDRLAI